MTDVTSRSHFPFGANVFATLNGEGLGPVSYNNCCPVDVINGKNTGKPIVSATPMNGDAASNSTAKGTNNGNVHLLATYG
eukprot:evm.model.NODE_12080_length_44339_cov_18.134035.10